MTTVYTTNCPYCKQGPMPAIDPRSKEFNERYHTCPNCGLRPRAGKQRDEFGNWHLWYSSTVNRRAIPGGMVKINERIPVRQAEYLKSKGNVSEYLRLLIDRDMQKM